MSQLKAISKMNKKELLAELDSYVKDWELDYSPEDSPAELREVLTEVRELIAKEAEGTSEEEVAGESEEVERIEGELVGSLLGGKEITVDVLAEINGRAVRRITTADGATYHLTDNDIRQQVTRRRKPAPAPTEEPEG